jgi:hypothetical protein
MPPAPRKLAFFQFPLRSLFIFTLIVAIISWLITIVPARLWLVLAFPALPVIELSTCILAVIYLRGARRAFACGFLISLVQAILLGVFATDGLRSGYRIQEWEFLLILPAFFILIPAATGWIGEYFFRLGEQAKTLLAVTSEATPSSAMVANPANGRTEAQQSQ